ncbi:MFS transporter [Paenibacillus pasadenensis]|uniref:MFS transporter n=1 Tax=Paenibacillus pasadenensis TaxID=217090 RepID=UPI0020407DBD|nr:MFS transporter [Paenibacillus pasadenensis]
MSIPAAQAQTTPPSSSPMSALKLQKPFLIWMVSKMVSRFGDSVDSVAYSWMVYQLTGSKLLMGSLFAVNFVPGILLSLFAGVLVDRLPKKPLLIVSYTMRGIVVALTAFLFAKGWLQPWHLFLFTLLNSTFECFSIPAETSLVPRLLPKPLLLSGNSLNASASRISELAGLALTGPLIAWLGISGVIWVDSGTFLLSALILLFVRIPAMEVEQEGNSAAKTKPQFWQEFKQGLLFVRSHRLIVYTLLTGAVLNVGLTPSNVMQPVYVKEILHSGPAAQSVLGISLIIGMILSGLGLSSWGHKFRKSSLIVFGCVLLATGQASLFIPSLASWQPFVIAGCGAFASGFAIPFINTPLTTYMMEAAPQAMLGRVSSVSTMASYSFIPLGSLGVGVAGSIVSVEWLFLAAGVIMAVPAFFLLTRKEFMKI